MNKISYFGSIALLHKVLVTHYTTHVGTISFLHYLLITELIRPHSAGEGETANALTA